MKIIVNEKQPKTIEVDGRFYKYGRYYYKIVDAETAVEVHLKDDDMYIKIIAPDVIFDGGMVPDKITKVEFNDVYDTVMAEIKLAMEDKPIDGDHEDSTSHQERIAIGER